MKELDSQANETIASKFMVLKGFIHKDCNGEVERDRYWGQVYCLTCMVMVPSSSLIRKSATIAETKVES